MAFAPLRFEPYERAASVPNVVVDGSPNPGTVLTLSHWPRIPAPDGLAADLSAEMAFLYVERGGGQHGSAEVVTNNHFDQDGLVGMYALVRPDDALARRALLEDLAAAGDFATYRDRRAARLSTVLAAFADQTRSPLAPLPRDSEERTAVLCSELLGRLPELIDRLDDHRDLWGEEDERLDASEAALAHGEVTIEEHPGVDLAVVTVPEAVAARTGKGGHRFAHQRYTGIHPMALNNATSRMTLLLIRGQRYRLTCRYEGWVQYRSRPAPARVDLAPLAEQLTAKETGTVTWQADGVDALTPQLSTRDWDESSLPAADVVTAVLDHLRTAPPAWTPYPA